MYSMKISVNLDKYSMVCQVYAFFQTVGMHSLAQLWIRPTENTHLCRELMPMEQWIYKYYTTNEI